MIKQINSEALVIKTINYKESDKIITLLTKEIGKIDCIAKSIRTSKSKKRSHLDLFNLLDVQIIKGKAWYIIGQTNITETFSDLKSNYNSLEMAYFTIEIVNLMTPNSENNSRYYSFIIKTINSLEISPTINILNAFLIKIIHINGFYNKSKYAWDDDLYKYLDYLLKSTYDIILLNDYNNELANKCFQILTTEIEDILERKLKCKFII